MENLLETKKISKNKKEFDYPLLVDTAILLGEIMLKNGAETHIVEETMDRLLSTTQMKHIETVVMTTSIMVTLSDPSLEHITAISRIHERVNNLNRVYRAHQLVDDYCAKKISLKEIFSELKKLKKANQYNNFFKAIGLILIPPSFTIMLSGTYLDAISATICGIVIVILNRLFSYVQTNDFIKTTVIMMVISLLSACLNRIISSDTHSVIIGVMMPYVPGIAITNAARDTFNADYMSGSARLLDAIIQALAVAIGVYLGLLISSIIL